MAHPQGMYGDPAKYYENRQSFELSQACISCIHHQFKNNKRECALKNLHGIEMSICGEFRPRVRRKITLHDLFKQD